MTVWPEGAKITRQGVGMELNRISREPSRKAYRFVIPLSLEKTHSKSQFLVIGA
jgi:hypothetical protein